jgi:probable DNA repair protein
MDLQFFSAVEKSTTVLTASHRLSRWLLDGYSEYQRDKGRPVWRTPRILPLDQWLEQAWHGWMVQANDGQSILLNSVQEAALWESIIQESVEGRSLLRIPETAWMAMEAWALLLAYRLPFTREVFSVSDDCEAFFGWAREFDQRRQANGWIEAARLGDVIADLIRGGRIDRPFPVVFAGFDELTPQQEDLLDALCGSLHIPTVREEVNPRAVAFRDSSEEIAQAAGWARRRLQANGSAKIGVVIPSIDAERSKLQRAFEAAVPGAFHISKGPALSARPIVHAALLLLELTAGEVEVERMGMILRSPYRKGAEEERSRRALVDADLRKQGRSPVSIAVVGARFEKEIRRLPAEQAPSDWSRTFALFLKQLGWPGDRPPNSEDHQALEKWKKLLSDFASLDIVAARLDRAAALGRLVSMAAGEPFQPEDEGAPVQIAGLLEASGLRFDHLWVLGLHDEQMPPPAQPNPFLPLGLQRDRGLPHATASRELEFQRKLLARLAASAPEVVFSYPQWEGDQPRAASPLIVVAEAAGTWPANGSQGIRRSADLETMEDRVAPPLASGAEQHGGTSILKDMAACPFKAFARNRLGARELEEVDLGLNAREKGSAVHTILEEIWKKIKTQENLLALSAPELQTLIDEAIEAALVDVDRLGVRLERRRLRKLLAEWFEIEKARPAFRVLEPERKGLATIGDLTIKTRIDRVDLLPDGRHVIIDYKTGDVNGNAWSGERPDEPQVPLYCIATEASVAGAAFAQIRAGGVLLKGVCENGELGKISPMKGLKDATMRGLIEDWDGSLNRLAAAFRNGTADVDPKERSTCQYCRLPALCRIHDNHA